jgi:uncharacterized phage protein (TIGR01671 family)
MTREILFRGKRTDNGEWVEGFYSCVLDTHYIITGRFDSLTNGIINSEAYKVDPSTVGQFTGLTDRNGVKIFEGDIVRHEDAVSYIVWNPDNLRFEFAYKGNFRESIRAKLVTVWGIEDLGNIYDNPELL